MPYKAPRGVFLNSMDLKDIERLKINFNAGGLMQTHRHYSLGREWALHMCSDFISL